MNKNFNNWFHDGYTDEEGYIPLLQRFMKASLGDPVLDPFKLMHYIIDYHYVYMAMKDHITALESKVYALQETLDGGPEPLTPGDLRSM